MRCVTVYCPNPTASLNIPVQTVPFSERLRAPLARLAAAPWLPPVVNAIAIIVFVVSLARWTWQLIAPIVPSGLHGIAITASAPPARFTVSDIESADLFGAAPVSAGNLDAIPVSSLNLVLTGIVEAGSRSFALMKANGHHQAPFVVGQQVAPGTSLVAVYADRVLIRHEGRVESVLLKQPVSAGVQGLAPETTAIPPPPVHRVRQGHYLVPPALVKQEVANPEPLFHQALMVPYEAGGFLIRSIAPGSLYQQLGLKPGDVIRSVNGQPIDSLAQAMQVYRHLPVSGEINLRILRNGHAKELHYRIQ